MLNNPQRFGIIYLAVNLLNSKVYIGQTKYSLDTRRRQHEVSALHKSPLYFHKALQKYGCNNFDWICVCDCFSREDLNDCEKAFIQYYESFNPEKGYNRTLGGDCSEYTLESRLKMSEKAKEFYKVQISLQNLQKANLAPRKAMTEEHKCKLREIRKNRIISEETRQKMSNSRKGVSSPMKGKHHTQETKEKLKLAKLNKPLSEEHKLKIGKGNKGKKVSESTCSNISNSLLGHTVSQETRNKISKANLGRTTSEETKEKLRICSTGRRHKQESIDKMKILGQERKNKAQQKRDEVKSLLFYLYFQRYYLHEMSSIVNRSIENIRRILKEMNLPTDEKERKNLYDDIGV